MAFDRKPVWLKQRIFATDELASVRKVLTELELDTVCQEAHCPNRNFCFGNGQATFLIMGDVCTRDCRFCAISHGKVKPLEESEPVRVAKATKRLKLKYVVITSVTRDDIDDGGAQHFANTIRCIRTEIPSAGVEVLTPDFQGNCDALQIVLNQKPDVFNHNVETVPRLYETVRPQADFQRSLDILRYAAQNSGSIVKSGFMLGLGETEDEVIELLNYLRQAGVDVVTIGQYLQPSLQHLPVLRFVHPKEFDEYARFGEQKLGFRKVFAGPLVRSSFMASDIWRKLE